MEKTREKHLEEINQRLDRIESDLMDKPDSQDLEFKWDELGAMLGNISFEVSEVKDNLACVMDSAELEYELFQMTTNLKEIHDEMKELRDEVADVRSQIEGLEDGDRT